LLGARDIAELIGSKPLLVDYWRQQGLLKGVPLNDKGEYMYERPDPEAVKQIKNAHSFETNRGPRLDRANEVQYGTFPLLQL